MEEIVMKVCVLICIYITIMIIYSRYTIDSMIFVVTQWALTIFLMYLLLIPVAYYAWLPIEVIKGLVCTMVIICGFFTVFGWTFTKKKIEEKEKRQ